MGMSDGGGTVGTTVGANVGGSGKVGTSVGVNVGPGVSTV